MNQLIIHNQKELDDIPLDYEGYIYIEGGTKDNPLNLKTDFQRAEVIVRGKAYLENVSGSAQIRSISGSAQIRSISGSAQIRSVYDSAQIGSVSGSAQINLSGEAMVSACSAKKIICSGYNIVKIRKSDRKNVNLVMNKTSTLVIIPDFKPIFTEFSKRYPVEIKGKNTLLYKAVHKKDNRYFSENDKDFEYEIGKEYTRKVVKNNESCGQGLHLAFKGWAVGFGANWEDMVLLECETATKDIYIAPDCDGKVRTKKLKVLREVPKEEWFK